MPKQKFHFNKHTLTFERAHLTFRQIAWRVFGFISAAIVFATLIVYIAYTYMDSPKEKMQKREIAEMQLQYDLLNEKIGQLSSVLSDLQYRDDNIYRVIFESEPIPSTIREAGYGGSNRYEKLENFDNSQLMINATEKVEKLRRQLYIQSKSYDDIYKMVKNKQEMLTSIPAIQPINNKDLTRTASGFGTRIDPIYKTAKFHSGIDFTAPTSTEIYATGNGEISTIEYSERGYGNHVVVNHGYGYETLYGHMSYIKVRPGQKIKRGDIIGYVGNSGKSVGPHLHYEVIRNGNKVNPINYFYNDLSPAEYETVLNSASKHSQSFD